jgi:hypothetical protein
MPINVSVIYFILGYQFFLDILLDNLAGPPTFMMPHYLGRPYCVRRLVLNAKK